MRRFRGLFYFLLFIVCLSTFAWGANTLTRRIIGAEDILWATGGSGSAETFNYTTQSGLVLTLTKPDATYLKFRDPTLSGKTVESVILALSSGNQYAGPGSAGIAVSNGTSWLTGIAGPTGTIVGTSDSQILTNKSFGAGMSWPTFNQSTTGTAANLSGTPALPNGTTATTQTGTDNSTKLATTAFVQAGITAIAIPSFALLQNQQTQNTAGGTATLGAWRAYPLNTNQEDANSIITFAAPAFTLQAGTYRFEGAFPFYSTNVFQTRLYNITDAAVAVGVGGNPVLGSSGRAPAGVVTDSNIRGTITIAGAKQFRIEYQVVTTEATDGLGYPANFAAEVYGQLSIWKIQ